MNAGKPKVMFGSSDGKIDHVVSVGKECRQTLLMHSM